MDVERFREVYERLQGLDEFSTHKVRPRRDSYRRPTIDDLDAKGRELAEYTIELREIVEELMQAIAAKPGTGNPG